LTELPPESSLEDVSFTLQEGRNHWPEWRVAVVAKTAAEAAQGFAKAELVAPASPVSATNGELCVAIGGFTGGQDSLTCIPFGVAFDLYETHAAFRSRIRACASILDGPLRSLPPYDTPQGRTFAPDSLLDALGYTEAARLRSTLATHGKSSVLAADLTRSPVMNAGIFYLS
jgi:acyl transferase domain-containing protein|tara:strand:- start:370 stop:885 length:516 start_codon:yes stop_codon:yes gene_type:complete